VLPSYEAELEHDGRTYKVALENLNVLRCETCGAIILDDQANERISQALRRQARLLTPEEIHANRQALSLTQKQLAGSLGIAEATLSRWETGAQIQQRAFDRFLRVFFLFPSVRAVLMRTPSLSEPRPLDLEAAPEVVARARRFRLRQSPRTESGCESGTVSTRGSGDATDHRESGTS